MTTNPDPNRRNRWFRVFNWSMRDNLWVGFWIGPLYVSLVVRNDRDWRRS